MRNPLENPRWQDALMSLLSLAVFVGLPICISVMVLMWNEHPVTIRMTAPTGDEEGE